MPEEELWELYVTQELSSTEIASMHGCHSQTIINRLREYRIPVRSRGEAALLKRGENALHQGVNIPEEELRELYEVQKLSTINIGEIYGCSHRTVLNKMAEYGIESRTISEAMALVEGHPKTDFSGDLAEKAYLIGFCLGDLYAAMISETGHTIWLSCSTTKQEQVELIKELFQRYGRVHVGTYSEGRFEIDCYLNMTFDFLLPKQDIIESWIVEEPIKYFIPFLAGYTDAEGHIGVSKGIAVFSLASCDRNILHQCYDVLASIGITFPKPRIKKEKGYTDKRGITYSEDYWELATARKDSLLRLFDLLDPYLKHAKRRRDMELARANIEERNAREEERRVHITETELRRLYEEEGLTREEIAQVFGCCASTVGVRMREYGIDVRTNRVEVTEADLRYLYEERELSQSEIAEILGCSQASVYYKMQEYGIKARSLSEAQALWHAKRRDRE